MASRGRRRFLQWGLAGAAAGAAWRGGGARAAGEKPPKVRVAEDKPPAGSDELPEGKMPMRALGRTGVQVSLVGLGGYHIGLAPDQQAATRLVRAAIDHGVNFMDNCWDYNDGKSHVWMGRALGDGYRRRVFLMTKIDGRTRQAAAEQIEQSLRDLGTEVIDLLQVHEVIRDCPIPTACSARTAPSRRWSRREGGQDSLHRFHRAQEPGDPSARCWRWRRRTASPSTPCRCR